MTAVLPTEPTPADDRVIWQPELRELLGGVSQVTIKRHRDNGKLPAPDVMMSRKTVGWRWSTLCAAGVRLL